MKRIAYVRQLVHEPDQSLQLRTLQQHQCDLYFFETEGLQRTELAKLKEEVKPGDTVIVYRFDVLGKDMPHLVNFVAYLSANGIGFISVIEGINTNLPSGNGFYRYIEQLQQFQNLRNEEKTVLDRLNNLAPKTSGRNPKLEGKYLAQLKNLIEQKNYTISDICRIMDITKPTYYRYTKLLGID